MTANELRAKRANLWEQQKAIRDKALVTENRVMNSEEHTEFNRIEAEMKTLLEQAEAIERHDANGANLNDTRGRIAATSTAGDDPEQVETRKKAVRQSAFRRWMRDGAAAVYEEEEREVAAASTGNALRAMSLGVDAQGGYLAPPEFQRRIIEATLAFGGIRAARVSVFTTDHGRDLPIPANDDTANSGARVGENVAVGNATDLSFQLKTLKAYKYTSNLILVPNELLQDSVFDLDGFLARAIATRLGRTTSTDFTTGDGASGPEGVATFSTQGTQGATGQTTSIIYNDFLDLEHSVDPTYRTNAEWMFRDATLLVIKKLKDGEGRPLWSPGMATGAPDRILGYRYVINQSVAAMAASAKSILFGDFSHFAIRDVSGTVLRRLVERYAEYDQVGFIAFERHDSKLLDAGTHPIKHYANSAT